MKNAVNKIKKGRRRVRGSKQPSVVYFSKLKNYYYKNKRMPSYGELTDLIKAHSKNAATYWVDKWVKEGAIKRDSAGKLLPGKAFNPVKLLGTVQAGFPSPAEEENTDTISLDDWLIKNKEASFMLKVTGDSMVDVGIMPGDMVIVERGKQPKSGDIVIAEVDSKWTVKFFHRSSGKGAGSGSGGKVVLKAANKRYKDIVPREEMRVAGVVISVIRKY